MILDNLCREVKQRFGLMSQGAVVALLAFTWCVAARYSSLEDVVTHRVIHSDSTTGLRALGERRKVHDVSIEEDSTSRKQWGSATMSTNEKTKSRKEKQILEGRTELLNNDGLNDESELKRNMTALIDHTYTEESLRLVTGSADTTIRKPVSRENEESTHMVSMREVTSSKVTTESTPINSTNTKIQSSLEHQITTPTTSRVSVANSSSNVSPVPTKPDGRAKLPFDLYDRNLPCAKADSLSRPASTSHCEFEWTEDPELPLVRCELVTTLDKFGGHLYNSGWFSVRCDDRTDSGRLCLRPVAYTIRRREILGVLGASVLPTDPLIQVLRSEGARPLLTVVTSHGFREVALRLRPDAIGPRGLLNAEPCRNCTPDVWIFQYKYDAEVMRLYINRGFSLRLEFEPAFVRLATVWLTLLKEDAFMEELAIHGGERWDEIGNTALLPKLPRLKKVDLARNGLQNIATDNFRHNPQIQHLGLSSNNFTTIPEGLSLLLDLRFLDLSENPLTILSYVEYFRPLEQLRILNLSHITLGGFEPLDDVDQDDSTLNSSQLLPRLTLLDVSACGVPDLDTTAVRRVLRHRPTLESLSLSYNPLRAPPPPALVANLPALRELRLAGCGLRQPPALRLASNALGLRVLDLANNFLESPEGVVAEESTGVGVDMLDLSGNHLRRGWGSNAFKELSPNGTVNVSNTALKAFTPEMLRSLKQLKQVDLGGNPIDCAHCSTTQLREWLQESGVPQVLVLGAEVPLRCTQPSNFAGLPVIASQSTEIACHRTLGADGKVLVGTTDPGDDGASDEVMDVRIIAGVATVACVGALLALAMLAFRFRLELTYAIHVIRANYWISSNAGANEAEAHEFDAFVCYSKFDRTWVLGELLPRLEGSNPRYRLCLHERDFPLGSLIVQNIVECMARSRRTLIILTKAFVQSQWCQWELEMATHRLLEGARDFLVLVELERLEARELPRLLRLLVETRTFLQWPSEADVAAARKGIAGAPEDGAPNIHSPDVTSGDHGEHLGNIKDNKDDKSGVESDPVEMAWQRLRSALGPPLRTNRRSSRNRHRSATVATAPAPLTAVQVDSKEVASNEGQGSDMVVFSGT